MTLSQTIKTVTENFINDYKTSNPVNDPKIIEEILLQKTRKTIMNECYLQTNSDTLPQTLYPYQIAMILTKLHNVVYVSNENKLGIFENSSMYDFSTTMTELIMMYDCTADTDKIQLIIELLNVYAPRK